MRKISFYADNENIADVVLMTEGQFVVQFNLGVITDSANKVFLVIKLTTDLTLKTRRLMCCQNESTFH